MDGLEERVNCLVIILRLSIRELIKLTKNIRFESLDVDIPFSFLDFIRLLLEVVAYDSDLQIMSLITLESFMVLDFSFLELKS